MINLIETNKLKEHHKNGYYFTDIEGEKYEEVKRSIEAQGIRDPIKCTRDYTVISGHQRLRIARDLGLEKVPYQMLDVDEKEAEYLLIAENVERRGQAETDPIKKSRIANFLKEYWGVKEGRGGDRRSKDKMPLKTIDDISETMGESERNTKRYLKLHDLIPQLQSLVSAGKLGTTAGEQLAHLTPEVQTALYKQLGEEIAEKTVAETKQLRKDVDGKTTDEVVEIVKRENERLKEELRQKDAELLRAKTPKVEYKEVIREVRDEYTEQRAEQAEKRLKKYEERFGDISNYDEHVTATHRQDMIVAVMSFSQGVREFIKRYDYMNRYKDVINNLDKESRQQYNEAVKALKELADAFGYTEDLGDIIDADYSEII